ncbi:TIGR00341 family protein [Nonlabens antarcticus]|uniref:TIGR00341 family protein n=1 Tax=Nonlabens antarcticus TaxID=392714 RepID=UPI001891F07F|nr:TIGR00341 family protein [Nonlabens antarcticus]
MDEKPHDDAQLEGNQKSILGIWDNTKEFLHGLLDIREDSDRNETIESVRKDISFQGHNAWILVFSIFVASIGLNVGSTAVVIGAMLISPLMGPIVGMGLGVAINDGRMLRRSLINLGVMVVLSLITATLYFMLTPISELTPELEARTYPTILDVLVAIFGGLALIVAKAKKGTISNAIAGVAIATALMPPLCTAGYGIAEGNLEYFSGAMYLFSINTVFIGLSTFVVCKMLRFPMVKYANQKQRRKVSIIATIVGVLVLTPSVYLFVQLYQLQVQSTAVNSFMKDYVQYDGMRATKELDLDKRQVDIVLFGAAVPDDIIKQWKAHFASDEKLANLTPVFYQGSGPALDGSYGDITAIQEDRINDIKLLQDQGQKIYNLEKELLSIKQSNKEFKNISEEALLLYPELKTIAYAPNITRKYDSDKMDTVDVFTVNYKEDAGGAVERTSINKRLGKWLKYRIQSDSVRVQTAQASNP